MLAGIIRPVGFCASICIPSCDRIRCLPLLKRISFYHVWITMLMQAFLPDASDMLRPDTSISRCIRINYNNLPFEKSFHRASEVIPGKRLPQEHMRVSGLFRMRQELWMQKLCKHACYIFAFLLHVGTVEFPGVYGFNDTYRILPCYIGL